MKWILRFDIKLTDTETTCIRTRVLDGISLVTDECINVKLLLQLEVANACLVRRHKVINIFRNIRTYKTKSTHPNFPLVSTISLKFEHI